MFLFRAKLSLLAVLLVVAGSAIDGFSQIPPATDPGTLEVAPGFHVELIYSVPRNDEGSWVALAVDPRGRILASDQYGTIYRVTPPGIGSSTGATVENLGIDLARAPVSEQRGLTEPVAPAVGAHGLLYAFDSLYVMVSENRSRSGLWRLRDTDGDDRFDDIQFLRAIKGTGEHGPHALILSPDGERIYFVNGNLTDLPEGLEKSRPTAWGEDHLIRRLWDARGHARDRFAPGGVVGVIDRDGRNAEVISIGLRNSYDIAFDQNGELFTYDSDMEWDFGTPWYLPTRVVHVTGGGDFGWRSGAGRWPEYYADSLPAALDLGPGSPTGLTFGTGAKFPARYQHALFAADWTYGTLYAIHLEADGSSFRGQRTEFLSGKPLPLTDVLVNPHDGAMYFAVGGRRTQSALYRVTYNGPDATGPAPLAPPTEAARLRRSLEALHTDGTPPAAIDTAWPHLASPDRFLRFAARVVIEKQPPELWTDRALGETNPRAAIEALIALARVGDRKLQPRLLDALGRFDLRDVSAELRLPLLRAWQLAFTRMGRPADDVCARLAGRFDPHFPQADNLVNRELLAILVHLGSPTAVARGVPLLEVAEPVTAAAEEIGGEALLARNDTYAREVRAAATHRPDRQQIAIAYALRVAGNGWTPELRREYFEWFKRAHAWKGGMSFSGFLLSIRADALATVADSNERAQLATLSEPPAATFDVGDVAPKGPGRDYTVKDAVALIGDAGLRGRDLANGRAMFAGTACLVCHRFNGEGGSMGPDLTEAGSRYSVHDLLENIIEPSKVVSDQYGSELIELQNGESIVGRVVREESGYFSIMNNPFQPDREMRVRTEAVKSRSPFPASMMPPGLINGLNEDELKDLVAYILSGGKG